MKKIFLSILTLVSLTSFAQCFKTISPGLWHTVGIMHNNTMWAWGGDNFEALGNIHTGGPSNIPVPVHTGLSEWKYAFGGYLNNIAIKTDGSIHGWGGNVGGPLFPPTGVPYESVTFPTLIDDGQWNSVGVSTFSTGIKENGTLWAWGVGNPITAGNTTVYTPTQIGSDTDWETTIPGPNVLYALKTDGTLWRSDFNNPSLAKIGDDTWMMITSDYGIKSDGSLWNINPTDGLTQIGTDTNWTFISNRHYNQHRFAIKNDGTLWAWGRNDEGQLGNGTTSHVPINDPIQVGTETNWIWASPGAFFSFGKKADGTFWAWGHNGHGFLGLGDNVPRTIPTYMSCEGLSTDDISLESKITLLPNPVQESLIIEVSNELNINKARIYDIRGTLILEDSHNPLDIDVHNLSSGMYLLTLYFDNRIVQKKFIKK